MIAPSVLRFGWEPSSLRFLTSNQTVVLVYHGVPAHGEGSDVDGDAFEQHLLLLKRHFEPVDFASFASRRPRAGRIRVLMTFDDGFRNNADVVVPLLRKHDVPAVFFVSSRHSERGKYLWFAYLNALARFFPDDSLAWRGRHFDLSSRARTASIDALTRLLLDLKPHPAAMYDAIDRELPRFDTFMRQEDIDQTYAGMTAEQVSTLGREPLFTIGGHTCDHPYLRRCDPREAVRQIRDNLLWIERLTARRCDLFAYPGGDYDEAVLNDCRLAGVTNGFSEIPRLRRYPMLEIPRIGIYNQSADVVGLKVQWGQYLRRLGISVG